MTGGDPETDVSGGDYVVGEEGSVTMTFERGEMTGALSENRDTLRVRFRGRTGAMVRIDR